MVLRRSLAKGVSVTILFFLLGTSPALARMFATVEGGVVYEDNALRIEDRLVTSPTATDRGDFSAEFYADIGTMNDVGGGTTVLAWASARHAAYARFDQFDFTIVRLSAGVKQQFTDAFSGRLIFSGKSKYYTLPLKDSTALAVLAGFKEQVTEQFWLKQFYEFERNNADEDSYSYNGHTIGISAGYDLTADLLLDAGYSYLLRDYDPQPAEQPFQVTSHTLSASLTTYFGRYWSLILSYDREISDSNIAGTTATNNIFGAFIRLAY